MEAYGRAWADPPTGENASRPVDLVWAWWSSDRHAVYRATCPECGRWAVDNEHASFTASKLFSPWPKDAPPKIAAKWIAAKDDPDKRVTFDNTQLGKPHKRQAAKDVAAEVLMRRAENWPGDVPDGVGAITAGCDTQDDRVEIEFVGWLHNLGPGWPDARGWVGLGVFTLSVMLLGMMYASPEFRSDEFVQTIATLVIGTGFVGGAVAWAYSATKTGGELSESSARIAEAAAGVPLANPAEPMPVIVANTTTQPVPTEPVEEPKS